MSVVLHGFAAGGGIAIGRAHLVVRGMGQLVRMLVPVLQDAEARRARAERARAYQPR